MQRYNATSLYEYVEDVLERSPLPSELEMWLKKYLYDPPDADDRNAWYNIAVGLEQGTHIKRMGELIKDCLQNYLTLIVSNHRNPIQDADSTTQLNYCAAWVKLGQEGGGKVAGTVYTQGQCVRWAREYALAKNML